MSKETESRWSSLQTITLWTSLAFSLTSFAFSLAATIWSHRADQRSEVASIQAAGDMLGQAQDIVFDEEAQIAVMRHTLENTPGRYPDRAISEISELLRTASERCSYSQRLIDETKRLEESAFSSFSLKISQRSTEALEAARRCHAKARRAEFLVQDPTSDLPLSGTTRMKELQK